MLIKGEIINVNNTLLKWLDFERDEIVGQKFFPDLLGIGGKIYFESHLMPLLQMQGEVSEINLELIGKGTIQIPVLMNMKRVQRNSGDEPVYWISVLDITQRKHFERELIKAKKEAEETSLRLKQLNEELERFAYIASHDLQAPLTTISGIVDLIESKNLMVPGALSEKLFSMITSNTKRMKMMINDLLEYSKLDDNSTGFEPVPLNEICRQALELMDAEIQQCQAVYHIPELPTVLGVKIQLVRLFQNLFSNALKYRSKAIPEVTVSWEKTENFYIIRVKDNGMGFEQEYEHKIFGFMERLHTNDAIPGTGIGLSSCKRIVEKHGGQIGVESSPGKGTTFYFTLPGMEKDQMVE
jgi:light-regulated signal transduction histidine kinase (bacteriophytochrome)